jgi:predicted peroxiredoxin
MARKVLINLATGLEDPERVTVAFLVGGAAAQRGDAVAMWLTQGGGEARRARPRRGGRMRRVPAATAAV